MYTVIGFSKFSSSKSGSLVNYFNLFCVFKRPGVDGFACDNFIVRSDLITGGSIALDSKIDVFFAKNSSFVNEVRILE